MQNRSPHFKAIIGDWHDACTGDIVEILMRSTAAYKPRNPRRPYFLAFSLTAARIPWPEKSRGPYPIPKLRNDKQHAGKGRWRPDILPQVL
jgi:hypothetical protein